MNRYFVTIYARSADDLRGLQKFGLDLFAPTAKKSRARATHPFTIEGLLSIAEVEIVVRDGCRVLVEDTAEARANTSGDTVEFADWLENIQPAIAADRTVRE